MENQHTLIKGYRDLSLEDIALMNKIKAEGERISVLIEELRNTHGIDTRWVAIGATDLQTGIMALVRAVARPTTF